MISIPTEDQLRKMCKWIGYGYKDDISWIVLMLDDNLLLIIARKDDQHAAKLLKTIQRNRAAYHESSSGNQFHRSSSRVIDISFEFVAHAFAQMDIEIN